MKKLIVLVLLMCLILTGCYNSPEGPTIETEEKVDKTSVDYEAKITGYALELLENKNTRLGFRATGSKADLESANYIEKTMQEIGLSNVRKEEILLDGWNVKDAVLTIMCSCTEEGRLDVKTIGYYPTNMKFDKQSIKIIDVANGSEIQYQGKEVKDNLVMLSNTDNLVDNILRAKDKGAAGVLVGGSNLVNVSTYITNSIPVDIPVLAISENTVIVVRKYAVNNVIDAEITAESEVTKEVATYNVVGEIEGENKDNIVFVTANRDNLYKGFFNNGVSIGEMFTIAEELVSEGYKPNNTIRFVVTTGQEWGKIGQAQNEGIKAQLEKTPEWLDQAKAVIVLDGNKPLETISEVIVQGTEDTKDFLNSYTTKFKENNSSTIVKIESIDTDRITEANVWIENGVSVILQGEPKGSEYNGIENSSGDTTGLKIHNGQLNNIIDYYKDMIKEIDER